MESSVEANQDDSQMQVDAALRRELHRFGECMLRKDLLAELRAHMCEDLRKEICALQKSLSSGAFPISVSRSKQSADSSTFCEVVEPVSSTGEGLEEIFLGDVKHRDQSKGSSASQPEDMEPRASAKFLDFEHIMPHSVSSPLADRSNHIQPVTSRSISSSAATLANHLNMSNCAAQTSMHEKPAGQTSKEHKDGYSDGSSHNDSSVSPIAPHGSPPSLIPNCLANVDFAEGDASMGKGGVEVKDAAASVCCLPLVLSKAEKSTIGPFFNEEAERSASESSGVSFRGSICGVESSKIMKRNDHNPARKSMIVGWTVRSSQSRKTIQQSKTSLTMHTSEENISWLRGILRRTVLNPLFEYFIGFLLFMNALSIGFRAQHAAANPGAVAPAVFEQVETVFGGLFTCEILFKFYVFRCEFLRMKGWQWNAFDLFVVTLQDVEWFFEFLLQASSVKLESLSFTRLLRLGRVVRLLRMVRLIPELKSMVYLIAASMQSFLWTMVLLSLLMYGVAVHLTEVVADYRGTEMDNMETVMAGRLDDSWGSLPKSIVSLYQAILGGIDWKDLMDDLSEMSWSVPVILMMYVAFGVLVMLNLVTGVFVEGAQRIVAEDRDAELVKQAKKVFADVDDSEDQSITWDEFQDHLEDKSMCEYFSLLGMSRTDAKDLFRLLDLDGSGSLSIMEFVHGCLSLRGNATSLDLARIAYNFELHEQQVNTIEQKVTQILSKVS